MRNVLFFIGFVLVWTISLGQSTQVTPTTTQNYIHKITYKKGYQESALGSVPGNDKIETISYFDGLGRPVQSIAVRQGGKDALYADTDFITPVVYDAYGRQVKEYLPFAASTNTGRYDGNAIVNTHNYYLNNYGSELDAIGSNPYSEKELESSPLNRILKQAAPGKSWKLGSNNEVKFDYQTNITDEVRLFTVTLTYANKTYTPILGVSTLNNGYYVAGELYKNITKDENWKTVDGVNKTTEEFKDKQGRVVLKRTYNAAQKHDTYYVYDNFGNLAYVLPPEASGKVFSEVQVVGAEYIKYFDQSIFSGTTSGGGNVKVSIVGNVLNVVFSAGFLSSNLIGIPQDINAPCSLPNTFLGYIQTTPNYGNTHTASIENGKLKLTNLYGLSITGFTGTLTSTLPYNCTGNSTSFVLNTDVLNELSYQYTYDHRNRLVEKKIPGKDWEYIVYDKLDRPVLTQDGNLKAQNKWLFTKYDVFGRVAYTGLMTQGISRIALQDVLNASSSQWVTKTSATTIAGTTVYYNNDAYPVNNISELYTINYYDDYSFDNDGLIVPGTTAYSATVTTVKGLPTGSKVKVLGTSNWITSVTGYDQHRRAVWSASKNNYLGTTDIVESELQTMTAWLTKSKTTHKKTGKTDIVTIDTFTYDHSGKQLTHNQKINSHPEQSIAVNEYDALGQLVRKKVGGVTGGTTLQVVDYTYNIRGWLKGINDVNNLGSTDLFGFKLSYNDPSDITKALFNGNISQSEWKTASINPVPYNPVSNKYTYTYDALNRITTAIDNTGNYDEFGIIYDKNGNIRNLQRDGKTHPTNNTFGLMDNLTYTYANNNTSNKLIKVEDASTSTEGFKNGANTATEYTYDVNGNMTRDDNKGITNITYNHLNLPTQVSMTSGTISYIYDATGVKQRKIVSTGTTTDYASNFVYENNTLQFFNQPEGYVEPVSASSTTFVYVYQYKDHLGNIRLSYKDVSLTSTPSLQIVEENNYYPFGSKHKGYNNVVTSTNIAQKYKTYQGQELTDELGYIMLEFKYRHYDPTLGRFFAVDPLAADYVYNSTYAFQENKLGLGTELEGLELRKHEWLDKKGNNHIDYTANIKVVNNSSANKKDIIAYSSKISESITSIFSGRDAEGNINRMSVKLQFVNKINIKSDFAIMFTDKVMEISPITGKPRVAIADGKVDKIGNTEVNIMQLLIPGKAAPRHEAVSGKDIGTNGAHEFGHTVGLYHQDYENNKVSSVNNITLEQNNLMRTDNGKSQQIINREQRSIMSKTVERNKKKNR